MNELKTFLGSLASRKFLLALLGAIVTILNRKLGLDLTADELILINSILASFILIEGYGDAQSRKMQSVNVENVEDVKIQK